MRRREDKAISKHTLNLFAGDYEKIQGWAGRTGAAKVIRELVRAYINKIENEAAQRAPIMPELQVELEP